MDVVSEPKITSFFDLTTNTISYVVVDPGMGRCAIIDSVWDYDPDSGRTSTVSVEKLEQFVSLGVERVILSAPDEADKHAQYLDRSQALVDEFGD